MKHLLKLNEYSQNKELSLDGEWEKVDSGEYWTHTKSSDSFGKSELRLIDDICDKFYLQRYGFGTSIRIERESSPVDKAAWGPYNKLFEITIVKVEDEWFYIIVNDVRKVINHEDEDFYKADQITGVISFLNFKIKELNSYYKWL